jgi:hypothetical protein
MKRNYLTGKLRPVAGELHIEVDILSGIKENHGKDSSFTKYKWAS